ncbi:MAG: hypothetical protein JNJ41_02415 [Bacteroidia bacterium]|nr:hypothetical protein [Bacteroidia bacterium]
MHDIETNFTDQYFYDKKGTIKNIVITGRFKNFRFKHLSANYVFSNDTSKIETMNFVLNWRNKIKHFEHLSSKANGH